MNVRKIAIKIIAKSAKIIYFLFQRREFMAVFSLSIAFVGIVNLTIPYVGEYNNKISVFFTVFGTAYSFWLNRDIQAKRIIEEFREEVNRLREEKKEKDSLQDTKLQSQDAKIESINVLLVQLSQLLTSHVAAYGHPDLINKVGEVTSMVTRIDLRIDDLHSINEFNEKLTTLSRRTQDVERFLKAKENYVIKEN